MGNVWQSLNHKKGLVTSTPLTTLIFYKRPPYPFSFNHLPIYGNLHFAEMDNLPDDILLPIVKKVAASSTKNLFRFRATSIRHRQLARNHEVIRTLPRRCMFYLSNPHPCAGKHILMQQLSNNRHSTFCIMLASQLFEQRDPDVEAVKWILRKAADHDSCNTRIFTKFYI